MAGGTAAAIYMSHRISIDIDLFTKENFFCGPIVSAINKKHEVKLISSTDRNTLVAMIDGVKFSLFMYPYPLLEPVSYNSSFNIHLGSPLDIAAMKIIAICQRGTAKDFIDLQSLMIAYRLSLDYLIAMVEKKYGVSDEYKINIKKSLVYFDDAVKSLHDVSLFRNGREVRIKAKEWKEVMSFFKRIVLGSIK